MAAHTLVDDLCGGGLSGCNALDGDGLAAVGVAVGLGAHEADGESDDVLAVTVVGPAAGTETGLVVGDVSLAGAAGRTTA